MVFDGTCAALFKEKRLLNRKWLKKEENKEVQMVLSNTLKPEDAEFGKFVKEYRFDDWQRIDRRTKRELFTRYSIAVHNAPIGALDEITDWESVKANDVFDMSDSIEGQGMYTYYKKIMRLKPVSDQSIPVKKDIKERMCRSTIEKFIQDVGTERVQLFLDISPNFDEPGPLPKKLVLKSCGRIRELTERLEIWMTVDSSFAVTTGTWRGVLSFILRNCLSSGLFLVLKAPCQLVTLTRRG